MLYQLLKSFIGIILNVLNIFMRGNFPPFACVCIIVEKEQRFLVIERQNGQVVFPGGFMRWHEYPEQTVIREGEEETGLLLRPLRILGHSSAHSKGINCINTLDIIYEAEVLGGQLRKSVEGRPYWINKEDLLQKLAFDYLTAYQAYFQSCEQHDEVSLTKA